MALTSEGLTALSNASAATGVPLNLLTAQALQESGGNQDAVGSSGEIGMLQVLPSTGASLGYSDLTDIDQNAMAGATYDAQLYAEYGSWDQALAAYNSGPGTVNDAISNYGSSWSNGVPASTVNYYTNILGASGLASTSSAPGGISTPTDDSDLYDTSTGLVSDVSGFFGNLSAWEIAAMAGVAALLVWYLA